MKSLHGSEVNGTWLGVMFLMCNFLYNLKSSDYIVKILQLKIFLKKNKVS